MRRLLILAALLAGGCSEGDLDALGDAFTDVYFVKLQPDVAAIGALATDLTVAFGAEPIFVFDRAAEGFTARLPGLAIPTLEDRTEVVEWVELDRERNYLPPEDPPTPVPDDELPDPDPADPPVVTEDEIPDGLRRVGGPYLGMADLQAVEVAVLDTGVQIDHPDLNVVRFVDVVGQRTGRISDGDDPQGHGTHVAGTIGAIGDGLGVVGVAPGVPIHAVRVLDDDGSGTWGDLVEGLEYVLENPAIRVVNMSLGGPVPADPRRDPLRTAIQRVVDSGVVVCIAAGNESQNTRNVAPAAYDRGIIVSAYDASQGDLGFADFSNFGAEVDMAAPGVDIRSTWPVALGYRSLSGTSMATPHVAGAAAVALALDPDLTPAEVAQRILASGENGYAGQGAPFDEPLLDVAQLITDLGG